MKIRQCIVASHPFQTTAIPDQDFHNCLNPATRVHRLQLPAASSSTIRKTLIKQRNRGDIFISVKWRHFIFGLTDKWLYILDKIGLSEYIGSSPEARLMGL
jgi:hypothetical protein